MSTALATLAGKLAERVGMDSVDPQELITTLRQTAFKGDASDAQFIALLIVANQYGLNPWTKEIYAFPDKQNGIVPVVGVDGWSRIINENQQFDGMDFEQDNESCTCRIYRKDRNHPICVTEWMDECRREPFKTREGREITGPWQSHPKRMLRHKAMIQCARLAFGFAGRGSKMKTPHLVPLSKQAVVLLKKLHAISGENELMFVGFSRDDKPISENTVNKALRTMGYDTKKDVCGHGFRTMACSALVESGMWSRDAVEKQMSHQERNSVRAAYIHKAEHLEERKLMLQWWANYLDACKAEAITPFTYVVQA